MPQQAGLTDLLKQLAPSNTNAAQQASAKELPYVLLRRAAARAGLNVGYEVRRYPQHVSIATEYYSRLDAFGARLPPCRHARKPHTSPSLLSPYRLLLSIQTGTLGAYTNGANEASSEVTPYVPSLMSVRPTAKTMQQVQDDALDLKPSEQPKTMRWPMAVPAMREAAPPKPAGRLEGAARLELMPARTVAVLAFSDPTTEPNVRGYHALLESLLREDGLTPVAPEEEEQFRLAQFDALNSFGARRSEIWVDLEEHPW